ncbi:hypothetical protein V2O64_11070 [Verrucomicrobiaceae bacterium 227]
MKTKLPAQKPDIADYFTSILSIAMLVFFAFPKIMGAPQSVAGFNDFSPALGLPARPFMFFTGYLELGIALFFVAALIVRKWHLPAIFTAHLLLFGTMATGLLIELFARATPVMPLVIIAIIFATLAALQMWRHRIALRLINLGTRNTHSGFTKIERQQ